MRLSSEAETRGARNNIIYVTAAGSELELLSEKQGQLILRSNWVKPGYALSFENLGSGSVTLIDTVTVTDPGFADPNFATSLDVRLAAPLLPSAALAACVQAVDQEYVLHTMGEARNSTDLGAYGYAKNAGSQPTAPTPMQPPVGQPPIAGAPTISPVATKNPSNPTASCTETCDWFLVAYFTG